MSRLPSCPFWCTQKHDKPGPTHVRSIDNIWGPPANIDVDIQLINDGETTFVQVIVTDERAATVTDDPGAIRNAYRVPLDVVTMFGFLAQSLDVHGLLEFGNALYFVDELLRDGDS